MWIVLLVFSYGYFYSLCYHIENIIVWHTMPVCLSLCLSVHIWFPCIFFFFWSSYAASWWVLSYQVRSFTDVVFSWICDPQIKRSERSVLAQSICLSTNLTLPPMFVCVQVTTFIFGIHILWVKHFLATSVFTAFWPWFWWRWPCDFVTTPWAWCFINQIKIKQMRYCQNHGIFIAVAGVSALNS